MSVAKNKFFIFTEKLFMLKASFKKHILQFKRQSSTSRGVLTKKTSYYIEVFNTDTPYKKGIGECSTIKGLSIDPWINYESTLRKLCKDIYHYEFWLMEGLKDYPSIRFGLETALIDLQKGGRRILFPSGFTKGSGSIPINGLIWMGEYDFMREQIRQKLDEGYRCIKLKIGAIDFEKEMELLQTIRNEYSPHELELRVDANGSFTPYEASEKIKQLSAYHIHSIEQPIKQKQWAEMAQLCAHTPVPIALDEELISIKSRDEIRKMLDVIHPQYIILKPSLLGGFDKTREFIEEAEKRNIGWWLTSALEGNIGLNALAQWAFMLNNNLPQGLGTGQLFTNNIPSPLYIDKAKLFFNTDNQWDLNYLYE